jgi:RimJ/RimL family protein N-acetyltransferase
VVFADPTTLACWADPNVENRRSWRAFEKAGFRVIRDVWAEDTRVTERLVRLGRAELSRGTPADENTLPDA